ncbi:AAA family ATPase [Phormidium pseudopriestleyi FRX01]|uniref:AAA family ATPase n=1 Tax=Phormidium pseudopriestleyi FRX01 TaxID=1759528 RepID=A0ABS3FNZ3_9CYAN|nr:AAA family ATPase [Phormidium pseudopriestleyi]MBO0348326.1 AAA family ATPase [Phormidium pseudopriestleyi FRX01]
MFQKPQLTIQNFGPITKVKIEIKDILIFIGAQASGKSTISKAIFFFKSLRDELTQYFYRAYTQDEFNPSLTPFAKQAKNQFIKTYGFVLQFPDMELKYQYGNGLEVTVRTSGDHQFTDIIFNAYFRERFSQIVSLFQGKKTELQQNSLKFSSSREITLIKAEEAALFEKIADEVNQLFNDESDLLFLPAGRSLITTLSQQLDKIDRLDRGNELSESNLIKLDSLMEKFLNRIDGAKYILNQTSLSRLIQEQSSESNNSELLSVIPLAQELAELILKGSYRYQNGNEWIDVGDKNSTSINFASSGQQEVVWILLLIQLLILNQRQVFLVIEEPEAHLFPVAQKEIIDLIALLANQTHNQVLLTTHSPYILSSFNNLLYAHNLGSRQPEQVERVVNRHLWIDPNRLDAYILEDGKARSIFDTEMGLIESAEIDKASDIIVNTFNQLFELEDEA